MAEMLLDQYGRPIDRRQLKKRLAMATITGVRQAVMSGVSRGLTPERVARILREAEDNDPESYLALAEEIEEKDLHYVAVLGTRKRQVAQLEMTIEAASDSAGDQDIARAVEENLLGADVIADYMFDMLDAVGKGFSLGELIWETRADEWRIVRIEHVDPRFVRFDRETMRIPHLIDEGGRIQPLAPYKFVYLELKAKSGIPLRGGIIRPAAWSYLFKNYTLKDWMQFLDIFGLPLRVGKYPIGATEDDKEALLAAVSAIAVDAAGIIPESMAIEFVEAAQKGGSAEFFRQLVEYCDEQVSKAVLGQTGTTDATPGKLGGAPDHTAVREDIERSDARAVAAAVNRQIVRAFVDLNFGPQQRYPQFRLGRPEQKDASLMIQAAQQLVPLGLKVRAADIRHAVGLAEPDEDDEILAAPAPVALPDEFSRLNDAAATSIASVGRQGGDAIDRAVEEALSEWEHDVGGMRMQVERILAASTDYDDFLRRLTELWPELDTGTLAERLARLAFEARLGGLAGDGIRPGINDADRSGDRDE